MEMKNTVYEMKNLVAVSNHTSYAAGKKEGWSFNRAIKASYLDWKKKMGWKKTEKNLRDLWEASDTPTRCVIGAWEWQDSKQRQKKILREKW